MPEFWTLSDPDEHGILRLTLNRPPVNVFTIAVMSEACERLAELAVRDDFRILLIEGAGRHFSAGVDVGEHLGDCVPKMLGAFHRLFAELERIDAPIVAAVQGSCLGGAFELILACDLVLAESRAKFGVPEIQLGVYPPVALVLLAPIVGSQIARELILCGVTIDAVRAQALGLANHVLTAPAGDNGKPDVEAFRAEAAAWIQKNLSPHSGASLRLTKRAMRLGEPPIAKRLEAVEAFYLETLMTSPDALEGLTAFTEKRPPAWTHRS